MRVLLTGASGFAGAHMLKKLSSLPDLALVCPVTYTHGGNENRIPDLLAKEDLNRVEIIFFDLASEKIDLDASEIDLIINYASESHVDRSISDPIHVIQNNFFIVSNLLEAIRNSSRQIPLFHISTDEVYGEISHGTTVREWEFPLLPSNPYSASKAIQEQLIISYYRTFGISSCIFNITNMIGETQNAEKFLPKVIQLSVKGETINIDTDKNGVIGSRKYLYAGDVADGVWMVVQSLFTSNMNNAFLEKFHLSGSQEYSNEEIVKFVGRNLSVAQSVTKFPSPRRGYDLRYDLDSHKIRELGWNETYSVPDRISQIVQWTLKHERWLTTDYRKRG